MLHWVTLVVRGPRRVLVFWLNKRYFSRTSIPIDFRRSHQLALLELEIYYLVPGGIRSTLIWSMRHDIEHQDFIFDSQVFRITAVTERVHPYLHRLAILADKHRHAHKGSRAAVVLVVDHCAVRLSITVKVTHCRFEYSAVSRLGCIRTIGKFQLVHAVTFTIRGFSSDIVQLSGSQPGGKCRWRGTQ